MDEKQTQGVHKVSINGRRSGTITGVADVLSFDVNEILLETEQGMLMVKGSELHVKRLSVEKGEVDIEGLIDSLTYSNSSSKGQKAESLMGRLFK